ncbi:hypothetical protein Spb1_14780 [Planctopirus ephydatiae]|uniref:Uncharacterized protein n=1 Tax=Planctopirus ephydatiae TaxID=2528019 RepID=A0A518GLZ0_9PLAN|nr:hypothetical protein Spb1_14780 [Planctopirus ephydatiae]
MNPARCRIFNEFRKFSHSVLQYRTEWQVQITKMERKGSPNLYKFRKIPLELAQRQEFPSLR